MAAWRYEISLRVLKNISRAMSAANDKRNFVSSSGHVISSIYPIALRPFHHVTIQRLFIQLGYLSFHHVKVWLRERSAMERISEVVLH